MLKRKIVGILFFITLITLGACAQQPKELNTGDRLVGSYNTDLGLISIDKNRKITGLGGTGELKNFQDDSVSAKIELKGDDYYDFVIRWAEDDKTKKINNLSLHLQFKKENGHLEIPNQTYAAVRVGE